MSTVAVRRISCGEPYLTLLVPVSLEFSKDYHLDARPVFSTKVEHLHIRIPSDGFADNDGRRDAAAVVAIDTDDDMSVIMWPEFCSYRQYTHHPLSIFRCSYCCGAENSEGQQKDVVVADSIAWLVV